MVATGQNKLPLFSRAFYCEAAFRLLMSVYPCLGFGLVLVLYSLSD